VPALLTPDGDVVGEGDGEADGETEGVGEGEGEGDAVGLTVGVGVGGGAFTMFAVIVPGPLTVAEVELKEGNANVMLPVSEAQELNL
jgi:hypothetical protein